VSTEGRALGAALMEANSPAIKPSVELKGTVFGDSMQEIADKANLAAWEFFKPHMYRLQIASEPYVDVHALTHGKGKKDSAPRPKFIATYYAELS